LGFLGILGGVEITESQFQRIADCLPRQRGNVSMTNLQLLNALLYVVEHGCKWRGLPRHFGNWHTIYTRMSRWSKAGVLDRVFARLQEEQIVAIRIEHVCLDSTTIKVHPDGTRAPKKTVRKPLGVREVDAPPKFIWLPRMRSAP
jgi:transposase